MSNYNARQIAALEKEIVSHLRIIDLVNARDDAGTPENIDLIRSHELRLKDCERKLSELRPKPQ